MIEKIRENLSFWIKFSIIAILVCLVIFTIMIEWSQFRIQNETLAQARLANQNQKILHDLKSIMEDSARDQKFLIQNREIWNAHFIELRNIFYKETDGHRLSIDTLKGEVASLKQEIIVFKREIIALNKEITALKGDVIKKQNELNQSYMEAMRMANPFKKRGVK